MGILDMLNRISFSEGPAGHFAGLLSSSLPLEHFTAFWAALDGNERSLRGLVREFLGESQSECLDSGVLAIHTFVIFRCKSVLAGAVSAF